MCVRPGVAGPKEEMNGSAKNGAPLQTVPGVAGVGDKNSVYEMSLELSRAEEERFTIEDCASRLARVIAMYYIHLLRSPISFFVFMVRYNMLWEGTVCGLVVTSMFYFVYPLAALALLLIKKVLVPVRAYEAGNIFFLSPTSPFAGVLWDLYKALSPPMAQFLMNGGNGKAIAHSWWDHETHKDFWRAHLERVGARVPKCLGRWMELSPGAWGIKWDHELQGQDVVIKVKDESNGCGDAFLLFGEGEGMMGGPDAVEAYMRADKAYAGSEALVLEWIRPAEGQEVHSLDIVTVARPDGEIELLTVLYWGDCSKPTTTHTTRAGYIVDVAKEEIGATAKWYAPGFGGMLLKPQYSLGHPLPGVAAACQLMVEAHRSVMVEQPWLKMVGWDAILAKGAGGPVFFEGNYAQMRLPRRVFLSWANMWHFLRVWG